jgi:hypothetical protein
MTYEAFKAWKISRCRNSLVRARKMRLAGNHKMATWYLHLAQIGRQSLAA